MAHAGFAEFDETLETARFDTGKADVSIESFHRDAGL
jgi:hypothetical protein